MAGPAAECLRSNMLLILRTVLQLPNLPLDASEVKLLEGFAALGNASQVIRPSATARFSPHPRWSLSVPSDAAHQHLRHDQGITRRQCISRLAWQRPLRCITLTMRVGCRSGMQCLFLRLWLRKGPVFKAGALEYSEVPDVDGALSELAASGMVADAVSPSVCPDAILAWLP